MHLKQLSLTVAFALVASCPDSASAAEPMGGNGKIDKATFPAYAAKAAAASIRSKKSDVEVIDELFQLILRRKPDEQMKKRALDHFDRTKDREMAGRDLVWALLNTKEFMKLIDLTKLEEMNEFSEKFEKAWPKK